MMPAGGYNASDPAPLPVAGSRNDYLQSDGTLHDPAPAGNDPDGSYVRVPRWLWSAAWSKPADVAVWVAIRYLSAPGSAGGSDDGVCFASLDTIAAEAGLARSTVQTSLDRLVTGGAVTTQYRGARRTLVSRALWSPVRPVYRVPPTLPDVMDTAAGQTTDDLDLALRRRGLSWSNVGRVRAVVDSASAPDPVPEAP